MIDRLKVLTQKFEGSAEQPLKRVVTESSESFCFHRFQRILFWLANELFVERIALRVIPKLGDTRDAKWKSSDFIEIILVNDKPSSMGSQKNSDLRGTLT